MARRVFFSFDYDRDAWRVGQVRNSNVVSSYDKNPFYDKAQWETIKGRGPDAIKHWIDTQLAGTSVTVVLIGRRTASRPWVKYEIAQSLNLGKGLIGVDISKIKNQTGQVDETGPSPLPAGSPHYRWNRDEGRKNLGAWIENAAPR